MTIERDIAEIQKWENTAAKCNWQIGQKLCEIAECQRWKLRQTAEGKTYRTFEEFVKAEFSYSREWVEMIMRVSKRFTREEVMQCGVSKLRVVLQAPPKLQAEIMARLKEENGKVSVAECERLVRGYSSKHESERRRVSPVPLTYEQVLARCMRLAVDWQDRLSADLATNVKRLKRHGLKRVV